MSFDMKSALQDLQSAAAENGKEGAREVVFTRLSNLLMAHAGDIAADDGMIVDQMLLDVVAYVELIEPDNALQRIDVFLTPFGITNQAVRQFN